MSVPKPAGCPPWLAPSQPGYLRETWLMTQNMNVSISNSSAPMSMTHKSVNLLGLKSCTNGKNVWICKNCKKKKITSLFCSFPIECNHVGCMTFGWWLLFIGKVIPLLLAHSERVHNTNCPTSCITSQCYKQGAALANVLWQEIAILQIPARTYVVLYVWHWFSEHWKLN